MAHLPTSRLSTSSPELPTHNSLEPRVTPRLLEMGRVFLVIGALAFGGQGGLLALLSRDLAEARGWIEESEIVEAFTYVQLLPGAVVVQVVAYLGYRLRGWRGTAIATTAFLLPSVIAMLALAAAYRRVATVPGVPAALHGLTSAVVGLIALAAYKQGRKTVKDALGVVIAIIVCVAAVGRHFNPAVLVVIAGMLGVLREATSRSETGTGSTAAPEGTTNP